MSGVLHFVEGTTFVCGTIEYFHILNSAVSSWYFLNCYGKFHGARSKKTAPVPRLTAVLYACAPIAIRAFANFCTGIKFVRLGW